MHVSSVEAVLGLHSRRKRHPDCGRSEQRKIAEREIYFAQEAESHIDWYDFGDDCDEYDQLWPDSHKQNSVFFNTTLIV